MHIHVCYCLFENQTCRKAARSIQEYLKNLQIKKNIEVWNGTTLKSTNRSLSLISYQQP